MVVEALLLLGSSSKGFLLVPLPLLRRGGGGGKLDARCFSSTAACFFSRSWLSYKALRVSSSVACNW